MKNSSDGMELTEEVEMKKSIRMISTAGMIMAVIVFCLAGAGGTQGTPKINACTLLTKTEIQTAIGQNVSEGKINTNANPAVSAPCEYAVGSYGAFSILVKVTGPGETANKVMEELKKRKIPVSDAPGIGDQSFFSSPGYGMVQLNTFKGSNYLIITMLVPGATEAAEKTAAEKLMRKALTKI
jgi:hypothetical protein